MEITDIDNPPKRHKYKVKAFMVTRREETPDGWRLEGGYCGECKQDLSRYYNLMRDGSGRRRWSKLHEIGSKTNYYHTTKTGS
ncbi:hypothetical protein LCGC14_0412550 [marine sediment metagenome]|uniref:Uncharacterized protein n=1 Tax=marine sediment metagenome TaxID=412755 RepID=A0A0F9SZC4_9ZZZZ